MESMAPVISCLGSAHRVIALDLPGFGEAPVPQGEAWGTPAYAEFVTTVLAERGVDRADFVGHSFGAKISLYLSATSDVVGRLVLVGSSGLRTPPSFMARLKRAVSKGGRYAGRLGPPGRRLRDALYERIASDDYRQSGALRSILVKVVNEDLRELLPEVASSTLLVWGSEDDAVPVRHARMMEAAIPDAGLVLFEGAGHFAYLDEPDRFCRIVRHFLKP